LENFISQHSDFILDALRDAQPVQSDKCVRDVVKATWLKNHSCRRMQYQLELAHEMQAIAIIQSQQNENDHQYLEWLAVLLPNNGETKRHGSLDVCPHTEIDVDVDRIQGRIQTSLGRP